MTYFVNDKCIKCKYTDCVEVCPVDCFYEGENMLDEYSRGKWPVLTQRKDPMPDADSFNPEMGYVEDPNNPKGKDFSNKPGEGD